METKQADVWFTVPDLFPLSVNLVDRCHFHLQIQITRVSLLAILSSCKFLGGFLDMICTCFPEKCQIQCLVTHVEMLRRQKANLK
jgi:hypothetical protein